MSANQTAPASPSDRPALGRPMTNAERQRLYRQRHPKVKSVTPVTPLDQVQAVTSVTPVGQAQAVTPVTPVAQAAPLPSVTAGGKCPFCSGIGFCWGWTPDPPSIFCVRCGAELRRPS